MLGRWQPWHPGHTELFKRALAETGQVCIQIRTVPQDVDASGGRTMTQDDNPFIVTDVEENIKKEVIDEFNNIKNIHIDEDIKKGKKLLFEDAKDMSDDDMGNNVEFN